MKREKLLWNLQHDLVSHTINPFVHKTLLASVYCRVIGLVLVLCFLLHYGFWILTRTPPGYPVVALCCGAPATLGLQVRPLHVLLETFLKSRIRLTTFMQWSMEGTHIQKGNSKDYLLFLTENTDVFLQTQRVPQTQSIRV